MRPDTPPARQQRRGRPRVRRTPTRGRPISAGEGVVAPRPCPRPHLQGPTPPGGDHEITLLRRLPAAEPGSTVTLRGWVHRRRELAKVTFLVLRDRTGLAQVVLPAGTPVPPEETTVEVTGVATANAQAPGGVEVTEAVVEAAHRAGRDPAGRAVAPVARRRRCPRCSTTHPSLWRHPAQRARWELAAASLQRLPGDPRRRSASPRWPTPKFVESATESGSSVFEVDYFGRPAYLAQSPQFYKQQLVGVFERVYEVGPVFRAEPHDTVRHLAEYRSLDVELGFIEDHRDVLAVLREVLAGMVASIEHAALAERAGAPAAGRARRDPGGPLRRRARPGRRAGRRARPRARARAGARRVGAGRARQRLRGRRGLPDGASGRSTPIPQPGDERWSNSFDLLFRGLELVSGGAAPAPVCPTTWLTCWSSAAFTVRAHVVVRRGVPTRNPAARRLRDRARALGGPAGRGDQHPRGHALPARPAPPDALGPPARLLNQRPPPLVEQRACRSRGQVRRQPTSSTASGLVQMTVSDGV